MTQSTLRLDEGNYDPGRFHSWNVPEVLEYLQVDLAGMTAGEIEHRRTRFGANMLPKAVGRSWVERLVGQFHNVLIYVLIAAAILTTWLGHYIDAGVIAGVVVINALIGFLQEGKAERSLESIRNLMSEDAVVMRDGKRMRIPAEDLVVGDIVLLQPGDKVPADLRLLSCRGLQIQEAALTGESVPADKSIDPVDADAALGDRSCMAYSSTIVVRGQGRGAVSAVGEQTEIGRVKDLLKKAQSLETPLTRQLGEFGRSLTLAILVLAVFTLLFGVVVHGSSLTDTFMAAVGLAVAAIPEGLPAIVTITLAIGVERMARRNAIIRRLPAVETLGAVSCICSDKTGTFTRNEMMVQSIATSTHLFTVTGSGYDSEGAFLLGHAPIDPDHRPLLRRMAVAGAVCNDAEISVREGGRSIEGDPMEGAMLVAAGKAGLDHTQERRSRNRLDEIPFDSEHRFMATLSREETGRSVIHVKGAPERLLEMCARQISYLGEEPLDLAYWEERMAGMAARGERVLALAVRENAPELQSLGFDDVETDLSLLGLFGFIDPPRPEAIEAVALCQQAAIDVKMITGDHIETAKAIGRQLGLERPEAALSGSQLDHVSDSVLKQTVDEVDIFARTSPEGKLRIVRALQANNRVVAMTGDGVNDAPALKQADVGVSMGLRGTEAAKEAGEMVLADDNFASIASAVEEGRTVYDNLIKSIRFILPTNGGEALIIMAAVLFGMSLPITPVQILWVNMVTAVTLALSLAFEAPERNVMNRSPRDPTAPILSRHLIGRILFVSLIIVIGVFSLFVWQVERGVAEDTARTMAVNTLVLFEIFYLFNVRRNRLVHFSDHFTRDARPAWTAVAVVLALQVAFTHIPLLNTLFHSAPITLADWGLCVLVASSVFVLVEILKFFEHR